MPLKVPRKLSESIACRAAGHSHARVHVMVSVHIDNRMLQQNGSARPWYKLNGTHTMHSLGTVAVLVRYAVPHPCSQIMYFSMLMHVLVLHVRVML